MATFASTVDEELTRCIAEASELNGIKKPKPKASGPRTFDYPEGFKPIMAVIPLISCEMNLPIRVFAKSDWPEYLQKLIPAVDPDYIFNPDATLAVVAELFTTKPRKNVGSVLIHGKKGSGKSTLFEQICARINMPFIRVNCKLDMESAALFGGIKYDPINGMAWVNGPVAELGSLGGFLLIDEASRIPSGIMDSMMGVLEKNSKIYLADKPGTSDEKFITPNEWFRIGLTDNTELQGDTTGKYVSANVQDEALIDRIETTYRLDYLDEAHELAIITGKVKDIDNVSARRMIALAKMVREAYDGGNIGFTMSPRGLLNWAEKSVFWQSERKAFKLAFFNKLTVTDQQVVAEFYHSVFAENLR